MKTLKKLDGKTWLKYSISIWDDITKSSEEKKLNHPATYPIALVERLIDCYSINMENPIILDPFLGSGTTLLAAKRKGLSGIGFEVVPEFMDLATNRLLLKTLFDNQEINIRIIKEKEKISCPETNEIIIIQDDIRNLEHYINSECISLMITSPPYWKILRRKRTADYKQIKPYSNLSTDIGNIQSYKEFLTELKKIYTKIYKIMKKDGYAIINVMDIRQGNEFIPYHCDTISIMKDIGFKIEDIIIWDRRKEYNNLKPLGYPYKFIINKVHEYILIFRKK